MSNCKLVRFKGWWIWSKVFFKDQAIPIISTAEDQLRFDADLNLVPNFSF
jgi:hypothetical protein